VRRYTSAAFFAAKYNNNVDRSSNDNSPGRYNSDFRIILLCICIEAPKEERITFFYILNEKNDDDLFTATALTTKTDFDRKIQSC
jgi:hypothetical protein